MIETSKESMRLRAAEIGCPIIDFDIEDGEGFRRDVFGMWEWARKTGPFFYSDAGPGFWVFTTVELCRDANLHPEIFSNRVPGTFKTQQPVMPPLIPNTLDPPEHMKYRGMLNGLFTPAMAAKMEPAMRAACVPIVETLASQDSCDFMADFARPLPTSFFLGLMGIPEERRDAITQALITATFATPSEDPTGEVREKATEIVVAAVAELIADRRAHPRDDLMSLIIPKEVEGRPLNDEELLSIGVLLVNAGVETTGGALGDMFHHLAQDDAHREAIVANPGLIPSAAEELLRALSPAINSRTVIQDADFHGCPVRAGDRAVIGLIAANHDPALMPNIDRMTLDRWPNRHVAFGIGPHHCMGAHIARLEIRVALEEWHQRIPRYRVAPGFEPHHHVDTTHSLTSLPLLLG